jgi:ABC-2 type transport system permease protein
MKMLRLIIWKEFQHLRVDKVALRMMLIIPLVQLFVLGMALSTEVRHTPIAVVDRCQCPASASLARVATAAPLFDFRGYATSEEQLRDWMDRGRIRVALIIPADFTEKLEERLALNPQGPNQNTAGFSEGEGAPLGIWVDGQDASSAGTARGYLNAILNQWAQERLEERVEAQGKRIGDIIPFRIHSTIAFNPLLISSWYMVPGIAVILITMVTALLTGFSIVREKESGTLEQLLVTPVKPIHIVLGKAAPFFLVGFVELFIALGAARLGFGIPFRGNYLTLALFCAAYMLSSLGIGILVSTVARTMQQALFLIWFFLIFFLLLSGFFLPVENMPHWVQVVTWINPVRWFMEVLRSMFLKGAGLRELWVQGVALLSIGTVVFGSATLLFRRKIG